MTDPHKAHNDSIWSIHSSKIFNLEQEIMSCWHIIDDLKLAYEYICDSEDFKGMSPEHSDKISNLLSGIKEIGDLRFQKLFATFEEMSKANG